MAWWNLLAHPMFIVAALVALILLWVLGAIFLIIGLSVVEARNKELGSVMITVLIGAILGLFLPWFLGWILYWYIIKIRHDTSWGGAIIAWFLAWVIPAAIATIVLGFVFILVPGFMPLLPI